MRVLRGLSITLHHCETQKLILTGIDVEKKETTELIIYGKQPVLEALRSDHQIKKVHIAREMDKRDKSRIEERAKTRRIQVVFDRKAYLQKISGPVLHQGVVAILDEFKYLTEKNLFDIISSSENPLLLILDQIQDPHNLGAILRTAEIADVSAIILPEKGSASITPTVVKTSAGAVFHCPVHRTTDLPGIMENLKNQNLNMVAMVPHSLESIYETDLKSPMAIVVGSEGKGVRKNIQRLCDKSVSIPGKGKIDSLNASVSTAVVIFEAVRQRLIKKKV
jgi:23S rRNA (guanosine2251-2'-O)-methyltransferase